MKQSLYPDVEITTRLTFTCAECGDPLKAREDNGEVTVELCQSCRDDAHNDGYNEGVEKGKEGE
jgi:ribosomal protein L37AE/L43A